MDGKEKRTSRGVELAVVSPLEFLALDSKPRIPVGKNFRILAGIDRNRADIQYFRRRRLGKRRRREKDQRDQQKDFSYSRSRNRQHQCQLLISPSFRTGMHSSNSKCDQSIAFSLSNKTSSPGA